ncbi:MAG: AraC family transcriptional regulator [Sphingomonadales bacterium]|nr:AraC family transcriptional regulator [Sphingomonadales bacterium]MBU3992033.1 AraC family transcriptional regulator [Alphaproteobacteria bacterium]
MTYSPLVSVAAVQPLATALLEIGRDPARLLIQSGLDPSCLAAGSHDLRRIPNERLVRFSRLGVRALYHHICQRDGLPHYPLPFFRLMCLCLLSSPTLGDALESLTQFQRMTRGMDDAVVPVIDGEVVHLVRRYRHKNLLGQDLLSIYSLTSFHRLFSWLIDEEIPLIPQNAVNRGLGEIFKLNDAYKNTIRIGNQVDRISFGGNFLNKKIRKTHSDLRHISKNFPFDFVTPVTRSEKISEEIADVVMQCLQENEAMPDLLKLARQMGSSPATLRRRLEAEGNSFMKIRNGCRQKFAESLLGDTNLCIAEIAEVAQFSDVSAFRRSFKNLTGLSPSEYRAKFRGANEAVKGWRAA